MFLFAALIISLELAVGVVSTQPLYHAVSNNHVLADESIPADQPAPSSDTSSPPQDQGSPQPDASAPNSDSIPVQVDTTPSQGGSVNPSPTEAGPSPGETNPSPNRESGLSPTENVSPTGENAGTPSENNSLQEGTPIQQNKPTENPAIENSTIPAVNFLDNAIFQDKAQENLSSVLSDQTVNEVKEEEQNLEKATTPAEQTTVLLQNADNNVKLLDSNLKKNDFDDVSFNAVRLNDQIDKSLDTIQQLPPLEAEQLRTKIETVCKNAENALRPEQLVVPEDVEESLEITRGTCMALQK